MSAAARRRRSTRHSAQRLRSWYARQLRRAGADDRARRRRQRALHGGRSAGRLGAHERPDSGRDAGAGGLRAARRRRAACRLRTRRRAWACRARPSGRQSAACARSAWPSRACRGRATAPRTAYAPLRRRQDRGVCCRRRRARACAGARCCGRRHRPMPCCWRSQAPEPGCFDYRIAEHQTAGRGRRGRRWLAPPGGALCLSLSWSYGALPAGCRRAQPGRGRRHLAGDAALRTAWRRG